MAVLPRVKSAAVRSPPSHTSPQLISASGTYLKEDVSKVLVCYSLGV
jgi:hypothetical protein